MNKLEEYRITLWKEIYTKTFTEAKDCKITGSTDESSPSKRRHLFAAEQANYAITLFNEAWD